MLSKDETNVIKGVAVLMLLFHHLFTFEDLLVNVSYISIFKINTPIEQFLGYYFSMCIYLFIFMSGYGFYSLNKSKKLNLIYFFNKVLKLYYKHVFILSVLVLIGIFINKIDFNLYKFLQDIFLIKLNYNDSLWFLRPYIMLLLLSPLIYMIIDNKNNNFIFFLLLICSLSFIYYYLYEFLRISLNSYTVYIKFLMQLLPSYLMGIFFSKYEVFKYFKRNLIYNVLVLILWILSIGVYVFISPYFTIIYLPLLVLSIYTITTNFKLFNNFLKFIGKNSMNIYLVHNFILFDYFMGIVFFPKISLLILLWLVVICLIFSKIIDFIYDKILFVKRKVISL